VTEKPGPRPGFLLPPFCFFEQRRLTLVNGEVAVHVNCDDPTEQKKRFLNMNLREGRRAGLGVGRNLPLPAGAPNGCEMTVG
jgi:hypothetical protein